MITYLKIIISLLVFFTTAFQCISQKQHKVLILGIDGCRSDALELANTPTIDSLKSTGIFSYTSWHLGKTKSGPGWSSMLTGVWDSKHRVNDNQFTNNNFSIYPFFPKIYKKYNPSSQAYMVIGWKSLYENAKKNDWGNCVLGKNDNDCVQKTIQLLKNENVDIVMIHFDAVDFNGHTSGFELDNPKYIHAIEKVDSQIKSVLFALKSRANYKNEDWLILSSTDHGGKGLNHSGNSIQERRIWWLASGENLPVVEIQSEDPGSLFYPENKYNENLAEFSPSIVDLAATALHHLIPELTNEDFATMNFDGRSWLNFSVEHLSAQWGKPTVNEDKLAHEIKIESPYFKVKQKLNNYKK